MVFCIACILKKPPSLELPKIEEIIQQARTEPSSEQLLEEVPPDLQKLRDLLDTNMSSPELTPSILYYLFGKAYLFRGYSRAD